MSAQAGTARRMHMVLEPLHAIVYFAPEHRQAQDAAGLRGGWMAYFASRAAPLGTPPAAVVAAAFYNFAPAMVSRSIPDAWRFAEPAEVLRARYDGVGQALRRITGRAAPSREVLLEAETLLRAAADECDVAGRTMFAGNSALDWPDDPLLALWHGATLMREYRGDGHAAALLSEGVDGCEAHVLAAASGVTTVEQLRSNRGWTDDEWNSATDRLRRRGAVSGVAGNSLTEAGARLRQAIEARTDSLATNPWSQLGERRVGHLHRLLSPLTAAVADADAIPYPNPMALPKPTATRSW